MFYPHMKMMQLFMTEEKYLKMMQKNEERLNATMAANGFKDIYELYKAIAIRQVIFSIL